MTITDASVIALYPPIIFYAMWAVFLYGYHVIWQALKIHSLNVRDHALPIAIVLCAGALLIENLFYGYARIDHRGYDYLTTILNFVGPMKTIILCGLVFAVASYKKAVEGQTALARLFGVAFAIWFTTFILIML
jgi:hypothetical protein